VVNGTGDRLRHTLAHELGHDLLSQQQLPLWIEEGVVQVLTRYVLDEAELKLDDNGWTAQRHWWGWLGLDSFWNGAAFYRPDDTCLRAYQLAELLVRAMNRADAQAFNWFIAAANPSDSGESACHRAFGVSLLHFLIQVLGDGAWNVPARREKAGTLDYQSDNDE